MKNILLLITAMLLFGCEQEVVEFQESECLHEINYNSESGKIDINIKSELMQVDVCVTNVFNNEKPVCLKVDHDYYNCIEIVTGYGSLIEVYAETYCSQVVR